MQAGNPPRNATSERSAWKEGGALLLIVAGAFLPSLAIDPSVVYGQEAASPSSSARIAFNIPGQPLNQALVAYSTATGNQMFFNAGLVRGKSAPSLQGTMTRDEALERLLEGGGAELSHQWQYGDDRRSTHGGER